MRILERSIYNEHEKSTISLKGLPNINGDDSWKLPLAATYVIAPDRRIALSEIELDHRERLEPEAIVAALRNRTGEWFA